jgi:hypothetical protein
MQVIAITIITFVISSFLPCLLKSRAANYKNSRNMKHTNSIRQNKALTHKTSNPNNFIRIKTQLDTNTNRFANGISSRSTHGTHSYCKKKKTIKITKCLAFGTAIGSTAILDINKKYGCKRCHLMCKV